MVSNITVTVGNGGVNVGLLSPNSASQIGTTPAGNLISTNVQAALNELQTHINNVTTGTVNANSISIIPPVGLTATNVQSAINQLQTNINNQIIESTTALSGVAIVGAEWGIDTTTGLTYYVNAGNWTQAAGGSSSTIAVTPPTGLTATNVQSAINQLQTNINAIPNEIISSAGTLVGTAPVGAQWGIDTITGLTYYVNAGNWTQAAGTSNTAANIATIPTGNLFSSNVQSALNELQTNINAIPNEVISSAGALIGTAPVGAQWGVDTTTGNQFYVSGTTWTPVSSATGATNLTYNAVTRLLISDTGADVVLPIASITTAGLMSSADKTKLTGIQTGAKANVQSNWTSITGDSLILNKPATINDLTSGGISSNLSAEQGKTLKLLIDGLGAITVTPTAISKNALVGLVAGDIIHVTDDAVPIGQWRRYQIISTTTGTWAASIKVIIGQQSDLGGSLVVSNDLNNDIIAGTDSGAYLRLSSANITASSIVNTPLGAIASTNVQAALNELQTNINTAVITNLGYTQINNTITSSTGTNVAIPLANATGNGLMITAQAIDAGKLPVVAPTGGYILKDISTIPDKVAILSGTIVTINPTLGGIQTITLTGTTTISETLVDGNYITLMIDDGTGFTVTWPLTRWVGGTAPVLATTGYSVIIMWKVAGVLYAASVGSA